MHFSCTFSYLEHCLSTSDLLSYCSFLVLKICSNHNSESSYSFKGNQFFNLGMLSIDFNTEIQFIITSAIYVDASHYISYINIWGRRAFYASLTPNIWN